MTQHTAPNAWRAVLKEQGRSLRWLAKNTGKAPRTVYAYSIGQRTPPLEWLEEVARVLGMEKAA